MMGGGDGVSASRFRLTQLLVCGVTGFLTFMTFLSGLQSVGGGSTGYVVWSSAIVGLAVLLGCLYGMSVNHRRGHSRSLDRPAPTWARLAIPAAGIVAVWVTSSLVSGVGYLQFLMFLLMFFCAEFLTLQRPPRPELPRSGDE